MSKISRFIRFVKGAKEQKNFPRAVNYDITSRCNLKCEHCYWRKNPQKKELSDKDWERVFKEHVKKGATTAYLTGGEPTLRLNVVKLANKIFKGICIVSNGVIKIPEDIQCRIFISIDGPKEIHNKIRGAKVFGKVMKNIKNDKRVVLTPTLSTTNCKYIDDLVNIARTANVEGITFSTYTSHQKSGDPLLLEGDKLEWVFNKLMEVWKKNKDIVLLTPKIINLFKTKEHYKKCYFRGKNFISFDSSLNIKKPCVIGKGVNCKTCGCIVPIMSYALVKANIRAWFLFDRILPERYYPD